MRTEIAKVSRPTMPAAAGKKPAKRESGEKMKSVSKKAGKKSASENFKNGEGQKNAPDNNKACGDQIPQKSNEKPLNPLKHLH